MSKTKLSTYNLDTPEEHFEGNAAHILGIATYLKAKERSPFVIHEVLLRPISLRTLKARIK